MIQLSVVHKRDLITTHLKTQYILSLLQMKNNKTAGSLFDFDRSKKPLSKSIERVVNFEVTK